MIESQAEKQQYVYVLVRTDLSFPQIAVQASHAAIEATRRFIPPQSQHPHLVLLSVPDEQSLLSAYDYFLYNKIDSALFKEPDIGNQATALATELISGKRRRFFSDFNLLTIPFLKEVSL